MAKRQKRFEVLDARPVNKDGFVAEWVDVGLIAMGSPNDPKPSVQVQNGKIVEMDGKRREDFDFIDRFIADYAINADRAEEMMRKSSQEIARAIVDINVPRAEVVRIFSGLTPAKIAEVMDYLNVVEMMMGIQKMRARRTPGNQAHVTNLQDNPVLMAADAAEAASTASTRLRPPLPCSTTAPSTPSPSSSAARPGARHSQPGRPGRVAGAGAGYEGPDGLCRNR